MHVHMAAQTHERTLMQSDIRFKLSGHSGREDIQQCIDHIQVPHRATLQKLCMIEEILNDSLFMSACDAAVSVIISHRSFEQWSA